jgi:hypothetical protein
LFPSPPPPPPPPPENDQSLFASFSPEKEESFHFASEETFT